MTRSITWPRRAPNASLVALVVVTLLSAPACDVLTGSAEREEAEVEITALASAQAVTMVTSTLFSVVSGGDVVLLEADTQVVALPFLRTFRLDGGNRFFVSVGPSEPGDTASVHMAVDIDGRSWFDEERTLGVDSIGTMTFVYRFSQPVL